jgi:hypothetical protein
MRGMARMEKFYCEIWDQEINNRQCYLRRHPQEYVTNPNCNKCDEFKKVILPKIIDVDTKPSRRLPRNAIIIQRRSCTKVKKFVAPTKVEKGLIRSELYTQDPTLKPLIESVPFILNLDVSYWKNPKFLRWQLMRLNKMYREDFLNVFNLYDDVLTDDATKDEELISMLNEANQDYPPVSPKESLGLWEDRLEPDSQYFERERERERMNIRKIKFLRACKATVDPEDPKNLIGFGDPRGKNLLPAPEFFLTGCPIPIDYDVRFPLPYFVSLLPPYSEKKKKQGSPMNWARNLLAYELRLFGLEEEEIACLLFGIKLSATYSEKHDKIQQTKSIIKRITKSIENSYPLPL